MALCHMIGGQGSGIELHDLQEKDIIQKQKLCMEILNVANKISPGKVKNQSKKAQVVKVGSKWVQQNRLKIGLTEIKVGSKRLNVGSQ